MNRMICYYLYDNKSGTETVRRGVKWILETAKPRGGLIAVQERGNLQDYGREEGLSLLSMLDKAPHRATVGGIHFELVLPSQIPFQANGKRMLALHPQKEYIDKLYKIKGISEMFVISFLNEDIKSWIASSYAVEFGEPLKNS